MNHNQQKSMKIHGNHTSDSGGSTLSVTLDQIVDYAKEVDDKEEAERIELMCYRMFGRHLTTEAAEKIAEIPEQFKKKRTPTIGTMITINGGDKVERKTVIPSVGNYNENVEEQNNNYPLPQMGGNEQLKLAQ